MKFLAKNNYQAVVKATFLFWLVFSIPVPTFLLAAAETEVEIEITEIIPAVVNQHLSVSVQCQQLFSSKTISTIQSGLPSLIKYEIQVRESGNIEQLIGGKKALIKLTLAATVMYDIWNEHYIFKSEDTTLVVPTFDDVKNLATRINRKKIIKLSLLNLTSEYSIRIRVQIIPISVEQGQKITTWLESSNRQFDVLSSEESSSGFGFNMEKLVALFVGHKQRRHNSSEWSYSKTFKISNSGEIIP